jgi:serine/threonine-protein kinase
MELLEGHDMAEMLLRNRGPLAIDTTLELLRQVCRGLGAAHDAGIIHRDIKPHNLFAVDGGRTVKIMDFGIAKSADISMATTGVSKVMGSPAYLAPERLQEESGLSVQTDLYSLGVVMYQLFTNQLPFAGPDISTVLTRIVLETPKSPRSLNAALPAELDRLIMRCIARSPADRHANCWELRAHIEAVLADLAAETS